jgi:RNase P subunit RPR2
LSGGGFILIVSTPIRIKRLRPGDDTETYCGRCKAERMHQVVALNTDGTPVTVICRTCGGQHRFREKKGPSASPAGGAGRRAVASPQTVRDAPAGRVRPYLPKEVYSTGEWLDHPKFGQGKVTQARSGKIEVRFESGSRLLVHAGQ